MGRRVQGADDDEEGEDNEDEEDAGEDLFGDTMMA